MDKEEESRAGWTEEVLFDDERPQAREQSADDVQSADSAIADEGLNDFEAIERPLSHANEQPEHEFDDAARLFDGSVDAAQELHDSVELLQSDIVDSAAADAAAESEEEVQMQRPLSPPPMSASNGFPLDNDQSTMQSTGMDVQEQEQQEVLQDAHEDQSNQSNPAGQGGAMDSITIGQLRNLINIQRPKARHYSYPTDASSDSLPMEIDEFYSYVEAPQVVENHEAWVQWCDINVAGQSTDAAASTSAYAASGAASGRSKGGPEDEEKDFDGGALGLGLGDDAASSKPPIVDEKPTSDQDAHARRMSEWTNLPTSTRRKRIQALLSLLEVKEPETRQRASRALLYLLQGSFADTRGPEHQLSWIMENARMVRAAGGLGEIYSAFKIASWKHDWLSSLPDHIPSSEPVKEGEPAPEPLLTWQTKLEYLDEINLELALHFAQLYILVETQRGEEEWGDDLMSLDPPLPIYLFGLVAALREKNAKGYPVKKLLLLLWKSILASFGSSRDAARCKELARELEGLPAKPARRAGQRVDGIVTKATPLDLQTFQDEVAVKYPTYAPFKRQTGELPFDKIASAISPIPMRKTATMQSDANGAAKGLSNPSTSTPAPSPPPSPKPNKQKYQTDQSRPFVFPYSRAVQGPRMVPFAVDEASRLYRENMYVSLELWQLWRLREECIHEESGVASAADGSRLGFGSWEKEMRRIETTMAESSSQGSRSPTMTDGPNSLSGMGGERFHAQSQQQQTKLRGEPTLDRLEVLERDLDAELIRTESDHMLAVLDNARYLSTIASLKQKRADARRLQRVDILYRAVLPHLQSSIIVLLKLLLATVTQQNSTNSPYFQALAEGIAVEDAPPPTLEDIDIVRHREITSKAISGILLLLLKWFKVSHIMKFNFLSQLLVDSNCLLLILKMFGLTEINNQVKVVNEIPNFNFFRFCELNCGQEPRKPKPEDTVLAKQPFEGIPSPPMGLTHLNSSVEEVEYMDRYSFRNFFSGLNFTRILQKLTKRKTHRILLLVQYKSSAILKRTLKVPHPDLQLYALKVIKSQVPFCGRKWRQSNMKVITAIYLNCRPDLRDEWLSGADIDGDVEESLPQEQALRGLVKYYNQTRIGSPSSNTSSTSQQGGSGSAAGAGGHSHKRSMSHSMSGGQFSPEALHAGGEGMPGGPSAAGFNTNASSPGGGSGAGQLGGGPPSSPGSSSMRANINFFESETLPPLRRSSEPTAGTRRYIPDDLLDGYLDDYEDILGEVFGDTAGNGLGEGVIGGGPLSVDGQRELEDEWRGLSAEGSQAAWARLGEILGENDEISDSESVHSIASYERGRAAGATEGEAGEQGIGEAGGEAKGKRRLSGRMLAADDEELEEGAQTWESLSPQAMRFLTSPRPPTPGSPHKNRRQRTNSNRGGEGEGGLQELGIPGIGGAGAGQDSLGAMGASIGGGLGLRKGSDSSPLRPVLSFGPEVLEDDNDAIADDDNDEDAVGAEDEEPLPHPKAGGIDEVEHVWNV